MGCSVNDDVIIKPFMENKLPFPAPSLKDHSALKGREDAESPDSGRLPRADLGCREWRIANVCLVCICVIC